MAKITKEMTQAVTHAMWELLKEKGAMNKMVSQHAIETYLLEHNYPNYVPVLLTLKALIQVKYVRYYRLDSGNLVYGFTKTALNKINELTNKQNV